MLNKRLDKRGRFHCEPLLDIDLSVRSPALPVHCQEDDCLKAINKLLQFKTVLQHPWNDEILIIFSTQHFNVSTRTRLNSYVNPMARRIINVIYIKTRPSYNLGKLSSTKKSGLITLIQHHAMHSLSSLQEACTSTTISQKESTLSLKKDSVISC